MKPWSATFGTRADQEPALLSVVDVGTRRVTGGVLVEWRAAAAIHADPALVDELSEPLDDDLGLVPAPDGS